MGAGQPADTLIPVPSGFVRLADLLTGDSVFSADGGTVDVLEVGDLGWRETVAVTFDDGATARVVHEHPWLARDAATGTDAVYRTADIAPHLHLGDGAPRWSVPLAHSVGFRGIALPIDPYTFGDEIRQGFTTAESELLPYLTAEDGDRREVLNGLFAGKGHMPASAGDLACASAASLMRSTGAVPVFEKAGFGWRMTRRAGVRRSVLSVTDAGPAQCLSLLLTDRAAMYVTGADFVLTCALRPEGAA
ncbi:Uncharacterised protein (plasmid) [Tsukamurella tyrosinosolvens]|uniref:Intein N-terminal splicing region n=2 Tax=Tsukamurella tyrosinosolvens TaxID=57704 RepID=A0A1H4UDH3_TSUTY|nr:hypothetical protein AXK58_13930 [Tsukamurella tyrosinosolvens]SEC66331.1 hypothetical protein SAMN04489793_2851 [Tsukamurella tyrosinosolvens]VEH94125.1 Uncharacterised protein [Tsukamurella tyrosinosolvens]